MPALKWVEPGIMRARMTEGPPSRIRLPIMAVILDQMRVTLDDAATPYKILV